MKLNIISRNNMYIKMELIITFWKYQIIRVAPLFVGSQKQIKRLVTSIGKDIFIPIVSND